MSPHEVADKLAVADRLTDTASTVGTWGRVGGMGGGPDVIELLVWGLQVARTHQAPTVFRAEAMKGDLNCFKSARLGRDA